MAGIYKIENISNGKVYIGKSTNIKNRIKTHLKKLRGGYHHNKVLQEDFNTYGETDFTFTTLVECSFEELDRMESVYCYRYDVWNEKSGYNSAKLLDYTQLSIQESKAFRNEVLQIVFKSLGDYIHEKGVVRLNIATLIEQLEGKMNKNYLNRNNILISIKEMDEEDNEKYQFYVSTDEYNTMLKFETFDYRKKFEEEILKSLKDFVL